MATLYYNTVSDLLSASLKALMAESVFSEFRLVGGTALSLQLGHRKSIDIDLFTDMPYGAMDTKLIGSTLQRIFGYVDGMDDLRERSVGYSLICGKDRQNIIKIDLFYTDSFIFPAVNIDNIRMASIEEIAAMKMLAIITGERKKDYWDIHELLNYFTLEDMIGWGIKRHSYEISQEEILNKLVTASNVNDHTPVQCLKGKYWEFIVEDLRDAVDSLRNK